jgi:small subunit ribosomal protein S17
MAEGAEMAATTEAHTNPRTLSGVVVSDKMDKTITVKVERRVKHPVYGKFIRKSSKVHAHDEDNSCNVGDTVTVVECRPISKSKTWMLKSVDERATEV